METNSATASSPKRTDLDKFLAAQAKQDQLRFITCGSVDDGKSTLIGRLLWEGQQLFDDQLAALKTDSEKFGTQGENIDFALLVDGLAAEREQGITIDVAYRYFATKRRKFIVADTPGHEQYTRNMVTAASTAEVAVLLVDARKGILTQTKRHAFLASLLGVRHVVLAVNKMDAVDFDGAMFGKIQSAFDLFAATLGFAQVVAIPVSALKGDNITSRSARTPWYDGPTLMSYLETVKIAASTARGLVFPVQWINRPNADFRGISGTIAEGQLTVGDEIRVTGSGQTATIAELVAMGDNRTSAIAGDAVTICLDRQIDVSRGDILAPAQSPLEMTDQFEATVVWMSDDAGLIGRNYDIKLATQWASASITNIKYRLDVNTLSHDASTSLALNDVSVCNLALSRPVVFDTYEQSKVLGGFILVDRFTQSTVAAGMIRHTLRRAQNVHRQELSITRQDRERLNGHRGQVIWFTGLSGSGKSTIANALEIELRSQGLRTYILDGDNIRQGLNKDLGFSDADRVENIRRVAEVARLMMDAGLIVLTAFISPFQQERQLARSLIGDENFFEVYVSTSLAVCEQRDPKGLYKKARNGQLPNMTGINSDYEVPSKPELTLETAKQSVAETVRQLLSVLTI